MCKLIQQVANWGQLAHELAIRCKFIQNSCVRDTWHCYFDDKITAYFPILQV